MKITVVIPVYRTPKRAADIAEKLLADPWVDKEVLIAVDGDTNPDIEAALAPLKGRIILHYNGCQLGKAATLNRIALSFETDVFLMLDNDILIPENSRFLTNLAEEMKSCDFAEIPKESIHGSFISRMMAFEFLTYAMLSHTLATWAHRSPSMNGAAFAVHARLFRDLGGFSDVVNEDMDFAARAFARNARFGFPEAIKVGNDTPNTLQDWYIQRKRWALNNVLWLKKYGMLLLSRLPGMPALFLSTLLLLLPFLMNIAAFLAAKHSHVLLFMPIAFHLSQHFRLLWGLLLNHSELALLSIDGWIATMAGMLIAGVIFFVYARLMRFRFNIIDFLLFYLIYSPVWMLANIIVFIAVLLGIDIKVDWKISGNTTREA